MVWFHLVFLNFSSYNPLSKGFPITDCHSFEFHVVYAALYLRQLKLKSVVCPGGYSHMKQMGMLVGNFEKETIWAWLKVFVTPKGDQSGRGLSKF